MGAHISKTLSLLDSKKTSRILILGTKGAGKSTLLRNLKLGNIQTLTPTVWDISKGLVQGEKQTAVSIEAMIRKKYEFYSWDSEFCNDDVVETYWKSYLVQADALIWMVDMANVDTLNNQVALLSQLLSNESLSDTIVMVLLNKQHVEKSLLDKHIQHYSQAFQHPDLVKTRKWALYTCNASSLEGVLEGMEWLVQAIKTKKQTPTSSARTMDHSYPHS